MGKPNVGSIVWQDLTVEDAEGVRAFYEQVVGWTSEAVDMDGYSDFSMVTAEGEGVAGICHARGANTGVPPQWLLYVTVADLDASIGQCTRLGGEVVTPPRPLAGGRMCVVKDPAGAVCGLFEGPE